MAAYVLALLVVAIFFSYVGRQVPTLFIGPVRADFGLSDLQIGLLQGFALNLCFGLASLPIAFLIDRGNRIKLIWLMAFFWSAATALGGLATEFWQLFASRMVVGLSEAGLVPVTYSLIADLYPPRVRAKATYIYYAGTLLGASAGIGLMGTALNAISANGEILPAVLSGLAVWRIAFLSAGFVTIPMLVLLAFAREPNRQVGEDRPAEIAGTETLRSHLRDNGAGIARIIFGIVLMMVGVDALLTWTPAILVRSYGTSAGNAGELLGLLWGVGSIFGVLIAGVLSSSAGRRRSILTIVRVGAAASAMVFIAFLFAGSVNQFLTLLTAYFCTVFIGASTAPLLLTSLAPNHLRGQILALWVIASAITSAISPAVIGYLSDRFAQVPDGLRLATCAVVIPCSIVGLLLLQVSGNSRIPRWE
jgi:predicted MFS family arabinose efflux permease